jgi:hypothetical protein
VTDAVVPTDLEIDVDCDLTDVHVRGGISVARGVTLTAERLVVEGGTNIFGDTDLVDSSMRGDVWLYEVEEPQTFSALATTFRGSVKGAAGTVSLRYSRVDGFVEVTTSEITRLQSSTVAFPVTTRGGRLVVHDTTFLHSLESIGNGDVLLCRVSVAQSLFLSGLTDYARLAVEGTQRCRSHVGGSVYLRDNPHSIDLGPLEIERDLVCSGNTGPRGITGLGEVWVGRQRTGQCSV